MFVYDVGNLQSFKNIDKILKEVNEFETMNTNRTRKTMNTVKILVGNKCDTKKLVDDNEVKAFVDKNGLKFIENSSKDLKNIEKLFELACSSVDLFELSCSSFDLFG
jgi:GTPase SAR1 family protein